MKSRIVKIMILITLCALFSIDAAASRPNTEPYNERTVEEFIDDYGFERRDVETTDMSITAFDVGENGYIALSKEYCFQRQRVVDVYSADGSFLYGFVCNTPGSVHVEWQGSELNIVFGKAELILTVSQNGTPYKLTKLITDKQYYQYSRELNKNERTVGNTVYKLDKPTLIPRFYGYSSLSATNADTEIEICDYSQSQITRFCLFVLLVVTFIAIFVGVFVYAYKNAKMNKTKQ